MRPRPSCRTTTEPPCPEALPASVVHGSLSRTAARCRTTSGARAETYRLTGPAGLPPRAQHACPEHCRSVIFLSLAPSGAGARALVTTRYHRWPTEARGVLFSIIEFAHIDSEPIYPDHFPKSASDLQESIFRKLKDHSKWTIGDAVSRKEASHFIFYQESTGYWVKATVGLPYYAKNGKVGPPAHGRFLHFTNEKTAHAVCAILNSSLFYIYFITHGDCFHLSDTLVTGFPVKPALLEHPALGLLNRRLMLNLTKNAERKTIRTKDGDTIVYAEFVVSRSKEIIDQIDLILAQQYGFTAEQLDFIKNFDAKYRIGQNGE